MFFPYFLSHLLFVYLSVHSVHFGILSTFCSFPLFSLIFCFLIFQCILSTLVFFLSPVLSLFSLLSFVMFFDLSVPSVQSPFCFASILSSCNCTTHIAVTINDPSATKMFPLFVMTNHRKQTKTDFSSQLQYAVLIPGVHNDITINKWAFWTHSH